MLKKFLRNEEGQDLIEYALLLALLAVALVLLITQAGGTLQAIWTRVNGVLTTANGAS